MGQDKENRDIVLHFRVTPSEEARIRAKMEEVGVTSMSAYLRKMALDGYCVQLDFDYPRQISALLRRCSNNLNQYVRRANATGSIYAEDIQDLQERMNEIWLNQKESLKLLASIR